jgi:hypothetical protein
MTPLSRKVSRFKELQSIGMLKTTVTTVPIDTPTAPLIGSVDITAGRGRAEAAAAEPAAHRIIANVANEILLTMRLSIIVLFFVDGIAFTSLFTSVR